MNNDIIMLIGLPCSGKSTYAKKLTEQGYIYLNRDSLGGTYADLAKSLNNYLHNGSTKIVLDNTHFNKEGRKLFIDVCSKFGLKPKAVWFKTSENDCYTNLALRFQEKRLKHEKEYYYPSNESLFRCAHPDALKKAKDPGIFKPNIISRFAKMFESPKMSEGFSSLEEIEFERSWPNDYTNCGLILDYDETLRTVKSGSTFGYPIRKKDIEILPNRRQILQKYQDSGYILGGISNQSGIDSGDVTIEQVENCFKYTNRLLGVSIDYRYCAHSYKQNQCLCRKPHVLNALLLIRKYKLNPKQSIFVGDRESDKLMAERIGFQYFHPNEFFKE